MSSFPPTVDIKQIGQVHPEVQANSRKCPQGLRTSYMWLNLAGTRDEELAEKARSTRDELESKMTPAQIAEAQKLSREWKPNVSK